MNLELKENLIEIVQEHECIYNLKHKDYKNVTYKNLLWEQIGATIGVPGPKAKDMWRTLRDGYIRYKKAVNGPTGSSRKYSNYTWSVQMSFLDGTLERPTGSNISPSQDSSDQPQSLWLRPIQSPPSSSTEQPPYSPPSPETHLQQSQPQPTTSSSLPSTPPRRRKNDNDTGMYNPETVLDYHRSKKMREWDSVDHLFMSYAKSFRQLSVRNQGKIKVALAQMFAEAELDELGNNASNELNETNTQPSSPAKWVKEEKVNIVSLEYL